MSVFTGGWDRVLDFLRSIRTGAFMDAYEDDFQELAAEIQKKIRKHIQDQDLDWAQLAPRTQARKGHDMAYIETWEFMRKIEADVRRKGRFSVELTVMPAGKHDASGMSMQKLARILEFGWEKIPARPLWRPVMAEVRAMPEFKKLADFTSKIEWGFY